jgi:hypothetical protein
MALPPPLDSGREGKQRDEPSVVVGHKGHPSFQPRHHPTLQQKETRTSNDTKETPKRNKRNAPPPSPHPIYIKRRRKLTTPHPARGGAAGGGAAGGGAAGGGAAGGGAAGGGAVGCGAAGGEAAGARAGRACARILLLLSYVIILFNYNYVERFMMRRHGSGQYLYYIFLTYYGTS